ncbi:BTB/POZ protein [Rhizophagus irregularis DAOM 181602=DAOM 197198]|nr:BTB/POZ protein [Rhizophagus irregularis DAOM 181602=DAOM 197198]
MVENFLPKLSQNLLDVLNDEEFYDITIEVEIFQIILRYIYGGNVSLEECDALDIIKILGAASELSLHELVTYLQSLLPDKIFKSPNFSSIPEKILISLIQNDYLQMSEVQIWDQVIKWGIAQNSDLSSDFTNYSKDDFKTLKNTLQHCIPFIKFHNLTSKEFMDKVLPCRKLLPKELYEDLLKAFLSLSDPDSKPISKTRHHKTNDNLFLKNNDFVMEDVSGQAEQSVITERDELMNDNDIIMDDDRIMNDTIIDWNEIKKFSEKDKKVIDDDDIYEAIDNLIIYSISANYCNWYCNLLNYYVI